jgi:2-polyprenyl-3-methyl-5-hydroxy-6-metoxy-1,4-benzoquinol methylase
MAERAHPDDPAFCDGSVWLEEFKSRYEKANALSAGKDVLDCPCGCGWGTSLLHSANSVTGIDSSAEAISYAKSHFLNQKTDFFQADMGSFDLDRVFDLIICLEGIEHVTVDIGANAIRLFSRHLDNNGRLYISAPIKEPANPGNPYHLHRYTEDEFRALVDSHFSIENELIVKLTSDVEVIYCLAKKKPLAKKL